MLARALPFALPLALASAAFAQDAPADSPPADAPAAVAPAETTEPAAPPAAETTPAETTPVALTPAPAETTGTIAPTEATESVRCPKGVPCFRAGDIAVFPRMRLRAGFRYIQPDEKIAFVGHNDGFFLEQGRLGLESTWKNRLTLRLIIDATSTLSGSGKGQNDPVRPLVGAFRDAYIEWTPNDYFMIRAGQSLLPFIAEGSISRAEMNFTARSIAADGVRAGEGYYEPGLSPDRQLGVTIGARRAPVGPAFVQYLLTVANGNGQNRLGNDNKLPAVLGRVGAGWDEYVEAGFAAQYNPRTVGDLPNLYQETDLELAGDVRVRAFGIDLLGQLAWRSTSFDTVFPEGDPARTDNGLGVTSWIVLDEPFGLPTFGIKPGYRFSYYDPRSSSPEDQLFEHTFGLRYDAPGDIPVAFLLDATLLFESAELDGQLAESRRYLDNHRVTALLQFDL